MPPARWHACREKTAIPTWGRLARAHDLLLLVVFVVVESFDMMEELGGVQTVGSCKRSASSLSMHTCRQQQLHGHAGEIAMSREVLAFQILLHVLRRDRKLHLPPSSVPLVDGAQLCLRLGGCGGSPPLFRLIEPPFPLCCRHNAARGVLCCASRADSAGTRLHAHDPQPGRVGRFYPRSGALLARHVRDASRGAVRDAGSPYGLRALPSDASAASRHLASPRQPQAGRCRRVAPAFCAPHTSSIPNVWGFRRRVS